MVGRRRPCKAAGGREALHGGCCCPDCMPAACQPPGRSRQAGSPAFGRSKAGCSLSAKACQQAPLARTLPSPGNASTMQLLRNQQPTIASAPQVARPPRLARGPSWLLCVGAICGVFGASGGQARSRLPAAQTLPSSLTERAPLEAARVIAGNTCRKQVHRQSCIRALWPPDRVARKASDVGPQAPQACMPCPRIHLV